MTEQVTEQVTATVKEAAIALGIGEAAVRKRLRNGVLKGQKNPDTDQWEFVLLPPGVTVPDDAANDEAKIDEEATALPPDVELAVLRERLSGVERLLADVQQDRDYWREQARAEAANTQAITQRLPMLPAPEPEQVTKQTKQNRFFWFRW